MIGSIFPAVSGPVLHDMSVTDLLKYQEKTHMDNRRRCTVVPVIPRTICCKSSVLTIPPGSWSPVTLTQWLKVPFKYKRLNFDMVSQLRVSSKYFEYATALELMNLVTAQQRSRVSTSAQRPKIYRNCFWHVILGFAIISVLHFIFSYYN